MVSVETGGIPGGWITFPAGTYQPDPSSVIPFTASPENLSYDRAFNRWIWASWNHISPDGRRFVTATGNGLDLVDAATGQHRPMAMPAVNGIWAPIDYTPRGVYLSVMGGESSGEPGLWLLNPDSGGVRKLDGTQSWSMVDAQAAWGLLPTADSTDLRRLDLQTGTLSTELSVPRHSPLQPGDRELELVALDSHGRPLVLERDWQEPYPWLLSYLISRDQLQRIQIPPEWSAGWPVSDNGDPFQSFRELRGLLLSSGVWFNGFHSFGGLAYLAPDDTVVLQLTDSPSNIYAIAGGCH